MCNYGDVIEQIIALYSIAGKGNYLTDKEKLEKGFYALMDDCELSVDTTKRIWGIVSDIYNRERTDSLQDDSITCLRHDLNEYFNQVQL